MIFDLSRLPNKTVVNPNLGMDPSIHKPCRETKPDKGVHISTVFETEGESCINEVETGPLKAAECF